eukprot:8951271-Pyramimonas_sp.AAC.1
MPVPFQHPARKGTEPNPDSKRQRRLRDEGPSPAVAAAAAAALARASTLADREQKDQELANRRWEALGPRGWSHVPFDSSLANDKLDLQPASGDRVPPGPAGCASPRVA